MLTVEKIGGTSMSRFPEVIDNIILRDPEAVYNRIYVVSAYSGVTNELLEHKKTGQPGIYQHFVAHADFTPIMETLRGRLCAINSLYQEAGLDIKQADAFISKRVDSALAYLQSMYEVLASGYVNREALLLAARELLASLGEAHSAFNSTLMLQQRGYDATLIDLSGWHDCRELTIDERIADTFRTIDPSKSICFVTGYTKGTEGIMREFDRGYSEVTFSKVAVLLDAEEAVIHKEFHLCSGDPHVMGEDVVRPVCNTNFDVADQLADVGMEAIHPKASKPLELAGIAIRVKNAFDPDHDGTLITKAYVSPESRVQVVTGSDTMIELAIHDTSMVGSVGFDLKIMEIFRDHNVSYISKATNANTISVVIQEKDWSEALNQALNDHFEVVTHQEAALVCAMGSNIATPGILATASQALAEGGINTIATSHTSRQTNLQFVIAREHFEAAQKALHKALCE